MSITFTEGERSFVFNEVMRLHQDANLRSLYNDTVIQSILSKFQSIVVSLTEQERRLLQFFMNDRREVLARLTDQRLQHILVAQSHQGFGAPGAQVAGPGNAGGAGGGAHENFFNSGKQYTLCLSILGKLLGS